MVAKKSKTKSKGKAKKPKKSKQYKQAWQKLVEYPLWDQVYVRLVAGEACHSLAKWWKSKGVMTHLAVKSLAKYLGVYRTHEISDKDKQELSAPVDTHYINTLVKGYANEIDVFKEMVVLINLQKKRLGSAMEKEKAINFPMEMTNKIVVQLHELLRDLFEFQVKTGRLPHAPQKFDHAFSGVAGAGNGDSIEVKNQRDEIQKKRRVAELALLLIRTSTQATNRKAIEDTSENKDV